MPQTQSRSKTPSSRIPLIPTSTSIISSRKSQTSSTSSTPPPPTEIHTRLGDPIKQNLPPGLWVYNNDNISSYTTSICKINDGRIGYIDNRQCHYSSTNPDTTLSEPPISSFQYLNLDTSLLNYTQEVPSSTNLLYQYNICKPEPTQFEVTADSNAYGYVKDEECYYYNNNMRGKTRNFKYVSINNSS